MRGIVMREIPKDKIFSLIAKEGELGQSTVRLSVR